MSKVKKAEILVNIELKGNDPDKAINKMVSKIIEVLDSDCKRLDEKGYKHHILVSNRKMEVKK